MQNQGESEFARTSVLENCAFFTCVQCGYCGYLILGGSAKELRDEEERHAIECKATHGLIGAGSRRAYVQKRRVLRNTGGLRSTAGSRPFRPWAPDPRCRELRPVLFYLEGLDQSLSGIKNWRARSRRRGALFCSSALGISIPQIACCGWCARAVRTPATERK